VTEGRARKHPVIRFVPKVAFADSGCWIWEGAKGPTGYGFFMWDGGRLAHRFAYAQWVGPLIDGMQIDHLCRVTSCVNPEHLEQVPPLVNVHRSESPAMFASRRSTCLNGHEWTAESTYRDGRGKRCRICHRESAVAKRAQERGRPLIPNAAKSHCPQGHEYTAENTYTNRGSRQCRACLRMRAQQRRAAQV